MAEGFEFPSFDKVRNLARLAVEAHESQIAALRAENIQLRRLIKRRKRECLSSVSSDAQSCDIDVFSTFPKCLSEDEIDLHFEEEAFGHFPAVPQERTCDEEEIVGPVSPSNWTRTASSGWSEANSLVSSMSALSSDKSQDVLDERNAMGRCASFIDMLEASRETSRWAKTSSAGSLSCPSSPRYSSCTSSLLMRKKSNKSARSTEVHAFAGSFGEVEERCRFSSDASQGDGKDSTKTVAKKIYVVKDTWTTKASKNKDVPRSRDSVFQMLDRGRKRGFSMRAGHMDFSRMTTAQFIAAAGECSSGGSNSPGRSNSPGGLNLRSICSMRRWSSLNTSMAIRSDTCAFHPSSRLRWIWNLFAFVLVMYDIVMVPIDVFFDQDATTFEKTISWFARSFWTIDIILSFLTGTYIHQTGILTMDLRIIALQYLKSWFLLDLLVVSTFWVDLLFEAEETRAMTMLKGFQILRFLRILRIGKLQQVLGDSVHFNADILTWTSFPRVVSYLLIGLHLLACAWHGLGSVSADGWVHKADLQKSEVFHAYLISMNWAVTALTGSYSAVPPHSDIDFAFAAVIHFAGFMVACWYVSKTVEWKLTFADMQGKRMRQACYRYLSRHRVGTELSIRMKKSLSYYLRKRRQGEQLQQAAELLASLPLSCQAELAYATRMPVIIGFKLFHDLSTLSPSAMHQICTEAIVDRQHHGGDIVFRPGDLCEDMIFVESGTLHYEMSALTEIFSSMLGQESSSPIMAEMNSLDIRGLLSSHAYQNGHMEKTTVQPRQFLSEAVLWTMKWKHYGVLEAGSDAILLRIRAAKFESALHAYQDIFGTLCSYARLYVRLLNKAPIRSDFLTFDICLANLRAETWEAGVERGHLIFISHYKFEAGTEATLMQQALEHLIEDDQSNPASNMGNPVFVDSENLWDLRGVKQHVIRSHNLVLLLTPGVLTRPWCLVEVVTALQNEVNVVLVEVQRPGASFKFPDEEFYKQMRKGNYLDKSCKELLKQQGIGLDEVEAAIRQVFQKIALPFSPHKSGNIRNAELADILSRCAQAICSESNTNSLFATMSPTLVRGRAYRDKPLPDA